MPQKTIRRIEDIDGLREGDSVLIAGTDNRQVFYAEVSRKYLPFCFGGILVLSEEVRDTKRGIAETSYAFDVYGNLIGTMGQRFGEEGDPLYDHFRKFLDSHNLQQV